MTNYAKRGFIDAGLAFGLYGVKRDLIYKWIHRGKLQSQKVNGRRLFLRRDLEILIQQQKDKHNGN
jgi:excisionase family DNA binding protein